MRYFAHMYDGSIKPVEDVCKTSFGRTYFTVDSDQYKYAPYDTYRVHAHMYCKPSYFYRFMNDGWYTSNQVKYFYELDEMEDEDLNYFQSTDFNAGVIYNHIEKDSVSYMLKCDNAHACASEIRVPAIQLLPKGCDSVREKEIINATSKAVIEHFDAVYGKNLSLSIDERNREKQHIILHYTITRKEQYKEMTVAEIEEALGYKIKVVGDK